MDYKNIFWNPFKLLSFNRLFNIAIGSRGCGKTFGCKEWCISDFLKNGKQFVYLRRTQAEIDEVKNSFFRDIIRVGKFIDCSFKIIGDTYYINDKEAGHAVALSTSGKIKSNSFPDVNKIVYDEFLIDKGVAFTYLKNEVEILLGLYETIDRGRDETRVMMLANAMSIVNPYFIRWGIKFNKQSRFIKTGKEIVTEIVVNQSYIDWKKKTRFGQFLEGTETGAHMIENEFVSDNYSFVEKLKGHMRYCFTCQYEGVTIGIWYMVERDLYYCSREWQQSYYNFAFTTLDHKPNTLMFKSARSNRLVKKLMDSFDYGLVRYESIEIKQKMLELFEYI